MNSALPILAALIAGLALGLGFFGGLWWTVSRVASGRGGFWLLPLSSLLRTGAALAGFWWVSQGQPARLGASVAGWLLARRFMIRRFGPGAESTTKGGASCT
jgi:F1F0 ATPase subunit 2